MSGWSTEEYLSSFSPFSPSTIDTFRADKSPIREQRSCNVLCMARKHVVGRTRRGKEACFRCKGAMQWDGWRKTVHVCWNGARGMVLEQGRISLLFYLAQVSSLIG